MALISFDHRVKVGGVFYSANQPILVQDAKGYLAQGAILVSDDEPEIIEDKPKQRAPRKKREA